MACVPVVFFYCADKDGDLGRGAMSIGSAPWRALTASAGKKGRRVDVACLVAFYVVVYFYGIWIGLSLMVVSSVALVAGGFTPHASHFTAALTYEVIDSKAVAAHTAAGTRKVVAHIGDACEAVSRTAQDFYQDRAKAFSLASFNKATRGVIQLFNGNRTGSGTIIESHFIVTAGHVIKQANFTSSDPAGKKVDADLLLPYVTCDGGDKAKVKSITLLDFHKSINDSSILLETVRPLNVRGPECRDFVRTEEGIPGKDQPVTVLSAMKGSENEDDTNPNNTLFQPHVSCGTVECKD
eukprot:5061135-Amphidinium_carterae.1